MGYFPDCAYIREECANEYFTEKIKKCRCAPPKPPACERCRPTCAPCDVLRLALIAELLCRLL